MCSYAASGDPVRPTRRTLLGQALAGTGGVMAGMWVSSAQGGEPPSQGAATFNVRDFGATGDGQNDDTAPAQAALDAALKGGGGRVHFPAGRYRISRSLTIGSTERLDITGDGWTSVLLHEADEPLLLWKPGTVCRETSVRHLAFLATRTDKSPDVAAIACLGGAERSFFSHLFFRGEGVRTGSSIVVEGVMDATTLDHCLMWEISGTGAKVARGSEVRIFGGRIIGQDRYGQRCIGVHLTGDNGGVHIVTTDLIALHTALLIGEPGRKSNRELFITHATFDGCVHGIVQMDHTYTSIAGCWAASCDEEQILLDTSAEHAILVITGGTIFNGGVFGRPGGRHGIVVRAGSFVLSGLTVRSNQGTGILVEGDGVRDYAITGCRIADNGVGAVLRGDRYTFTGNVLVRNGQHLVDAGGPNKQVGNNVLA